MSDERDQRWPMSDEHDQRDDECQMNVTREMTGEMYVR